MYTQPFYEIAHNAGKHAYKSEWSEDDARREAAKMAAYLVHQGRQSRATLRYFRGCMEAYLAGVAEAKDTKKEE